jgi:3-deoxy-D-manno-octulosonic-acid transferase
MTRLAYGLLWLVAVPFVLARLAWRARRVPGYLERVGERFGRYDAAATGPRIWVHAVSVGETRAAAIVIDALARRYPGHRILLTHMTPTGRATGVELFGDRVERAWLPYDLGFATRRFFAHFRPEFGVVLETELWPRLLEEAARAGTPVVLANARLSERSARRYARFPRIARWALRNLAGIAAQTEADARRFEALGAAPRPAVTGNVKFDLAVPEGIEAQRRVLRNRMGHDRMVWLAGSTREGEEALLLDAFAARPAGESALFAIVPRHPQRFDEVARLAAARGMRVARRSDPAPAAHDVQVLIGDSMGEMLAYYAAADVVLMGGSFLEYGSQNLIEPCAMGRPVIVGPHTFNFAQAAEGAIAAGAALRVADAPAALAAANALAGDAPRRARMGEAGLAFVASHRGAVGRLAAWLEATLAASRGQGRG